MIAIPVTKPTTSKDEILHEYTASQKRPALKPVGLLSYNHPVYCLFSSET